MFAARVEPDAAGLAGERHEQQAARVRLARHDETRDGLEVLARFLVVPVGPARRQPLQAERRALRVAGVAASQPFPLVQEHRLNRLFEDLVVERGGSGPAWNGRAKERCDDGKEKRANSTLISQEQTGCRV